jgi:hypothetical protein
MEAHDRLCAAVAANARACAALEQHARAKLAQDKVGRADCAGAGSGAHCPRQGPRFPPAVIHATLKKYARIEERERERTNAARRKQLRVQEQLQGRPGARSRAASLTRPAEQWRKNQGRLPAAGAAPGAGECRRRRVAPSSDRVTRWVQTARDGRRTKSSAPSAATAT